MAEVTVLGGAQQCVAQQGKWPGRSQRDLAAAVTRVMLQKSTTTSGTVSTLCVSPVNGSRVPCDELRAGQSILGDAQSEEGWASPATAKIKNNGALLGDDNVFVESLLAAVSLGDADIVQEVVRGATAPRLDEVWVTGDNVYVSGLDMSWANFGIGDLLVMPGAVILNTGYPHFACWKYAVRAGEQPKAYINSEEGIGLRMRGIKGSLLLASDSESPATIRTGDSVRIVRRDGAEYGRVLAACSAPLEAGSELVFRAAAGELRAAAGDTRGYVELLIRAGVESARIDAARYSRELPAAVRRSLGMSPDGTERPAAPAAMEISPAARSGDGTTQNVGIKTDGEFRCPDCRQRFSTERANQLHWKFIHDPDRHQED